MYHHRSISFLGPSKSDKPLKPFVDLISADKNQSFVYRLLNVDPNELYGICPRLAGSPSLVFENSSLSYPSYCEFVSSSSYVFLSHNKLFSGKLSGNLCDAVRLGIPIIARPLSPVNEIFRDYGPIGLIMRMNNFAEPEYAESIFEELLCSESYSYYCYNLLRMRNAFSGDSLLSDLCGALDISYG